MASLKDIAKKCGVSVATVSKALNDQSDIGKETKEKVQKTAQQMGYFPNAAARALKTHKSYNIGVLFKDEAGSGLTHEYFSGVLNAFKEEAESQGYDISFINNRFEKRELSYTEHCRYRNFEGVVIVCADWNDPAVIELLNSPIPKTTVDYVHQSCPAVSSNNIQGIEELVRYVYRKGHRRIAYIHGEDFSYVTKERVTTFRKTAEELGLTIPDEYIRTAEYLKIEGAARATGALLDLPEPPTCIFYPDDTALIGGRNVIRERHLRIPDDISIVGYDGTRMSQLLSPRLTTIRQDTDLIGVEAARRLISLIEKPKTTLVERVVIGGTLIPGESVKEVTPN